MKSFVTLFLGLIMTSLASAQKQTADAIFINGDIYTGTDTCVSPLGVQSDCVPQPQPPLSEARSVRSPRVQAMAISSGQIILTGTNKQVLTLKTKKTQVIDLGGRFVMAGFND